VTKPLDNRWWLARAIATASMLAIASCSPVPQPIARVLEQVGFDQRLGERAPLDVALRDERGRDVKLGDCFGGKPVVLSLVYYRCPMLCTQVLNGLVHSLRAMNLEPGRDFELVTVSIDGRDTSEIAAEKKASYVASYARPGADEAWHFLTSPLSHEPPKGTAPTGESAAAIARSVGFRSLYDAETDQFAHASGIVVLTPDGRVSKYFYGIDFSPRDLRLALVESSSGDVGTLIDQALLLCYHYDPTTGRYGFAVMSAVRVLGGLTVVALAALVVTLVRRERRALRVHLEGS